MIKSTLQRELKNIDEDKEIMIVNTETQDGIPEFFCVTDIKEFSEIIVLLTCRSE